MDGQFLEEFLSDKRPGVGPVTDDLHNSFQS